jgi:hypothetical protein
VRIFAAHAQDLLTGRVPCLPERTAFDCCCSNGRSSIGADIQIYLFVHIGWVSWATITMSHEASASHLKHGSQATSKQRLILVPDEHAAKLFTSLAASSSFHCEAIQRAPISREWRHRPVRMCLHELSESWVTAARSRMGIA